MHRGAMRSCKNTEELANVRSLHNHQESNEPRSPQSDSQHTFRKPRAATTPQIVSATNIVRATMLMEGLLATPSFSFFTLSIGVVFSFRVKLGSGEFPRESPAMSSKLASGNSVTRSVNCTEHCCKSGCSECSGITSSEQSTLFSTLFSLLLPTSCAFGL